MEVYFVLREVLKAFPHAQGTMGVGLGYAIAAAAVRPDRLVVAVEGDSAFGFSGMEVETIARWVPSPTSVIGNLEDSSDC